MGNLKGFEKGFVNSKIASHKVISDDIGSGGVEIGNFGTNTNKINIGLSSNSKASINPTTDSDENPRASGMKDEYSMNNSGGASGDGPTPGFNGSGLGQATLNGAQGRI